MRASWVVALVAYAGACSGGTADKPTVQVDPVPAPPRVTSPPPREQQAKVVPDKQRPTPPPRREAVVLNEDEAARFAELLTAESPTGISEGDMSKRRAGGDLKAQIDAVRDSGRVVAVGGGRGGATGDVRIGGSAGPGTAGGSVVPSTPAGPTGRISVASKAGMDDSTLTPDTVLMKIQSAYMAGVKRCYKEILKKDASARGKVTISFTVNETGRAVSGTVRSFSTDLDSCIASQISAWRFPIPKDKDGEPTTASFTFVLGMVPD